MRVANKREDPYNATLVPIFCCDSQKAQASVGVAIVIGVLPITMPYNMLLEASLTYKKLILNFGFKTNLYRAHRKEEQGILFESQYVDLAIVSGIFYNNNGVQ